MKKDLVTVKIERHVYKKLQQIKLDTDTKTVSNVIESLSSNTITINTLNGSNIVSRPNEKDKR